MHCTSLFKYICFKMGNIPSCCGIISKHMYQLLLHKMTPVRMKITKTFLEEDPKASFNHNCLRYYYTLKFKHPFTYTLYAHVHTGTLQVCKNIYKLHGKSCRASFFKKHSYPPPTLDWLIRVIQSYPPPPPFKILWRMKISILASKYLKINFLSELIHAGNNLSR